MTTTTTPPPTPQPDVKDPKRGDWMEELLAEDVDADTLLAGLRKKWWGDISALAKRAAYLAERCEKAAQVYAGDKNPNKRMDLLTAEKSLGFQAQRMLSSASMLAALASDDANGRIPMTAWKKKG